MSENIDIKDFNAQENLDKFRFNLSNEDHSWVDKLSRKNKLKSLTEVVTEDSINLLSDHVKQLEQVNNLH